MDHDCGRRSLVVIPTYNEAQNLALVVDRILRHDGFDVLVVDDSSPDRTGAVADSLAWQFPGRVGVVHRGAKLGLASAIVAGLRHGLRAGYGHVFHMDADLSHDPAMLPAMRSALERADVVVGSRYTAGAHALRRAPHRRLLSRLASLYAGAVLGLPLRDPAGGYRGYRRHVLEVLDLGHVSSRGYAVQIELNHRCHQAGFRFEELPITFRERAWGRSKMSLGIVLEALLLVAALRLRPATDGEPPRAGGALRQPTGSAAGCEHEGRGAATNPRRGG